MNKQSKHTPGPWFFSKNFDYGIAAPAKGQGLEFLVCKYEVSEDNEDEDLANARLIATAPELLEAAKGSLVAIRAELERLGKPHWGLDNAVSYLESAVAKAEGRE